MADQGRLPHLNLNFKKSGDLTSAAYLQLLDAQQHLVLLSNTHDGDDDAVAVQDVTAHLLAGRVRSWCSLGCSKVVPLVGRIRSS